MQDKVDMGHQLPAQWKDYVGKEKGNTSYKTESQTKFSTAFLICQCTFSFPTWPL